MADNKKNSIKNLISFGSIVSLKQQICALETDIDSIQSHIRAVEWEIECGNGDDIDDKNAQFLFNQRRRSLDKLREMYKELKETRILLVAEEANGEQR